MASSCFIFPETCVCKVRLGVIQQEYENAVKNGINPIEVVNSFNLFRTCCRTIIFNPPRLFLIDAESGRITDRIRLEM
jgi:DNA-directed RNA polymerase subunit N (RpoN/RPB10)